MLLIFRFLGVFTAEPLKNGATGLDDDLFEKFTPTFRQIEIYSAKRNGKETLFARFLNSPKRAPPPKDRPDVTTTIFDKESFKKIIPALKESTDETAFWIGRPGSVINRPQLKINGIWTVEEVSNDDEVKKGGPLLPVSPDPEDDPSFIKFGNASGKNSQSPFVVNYSVPLPTCESGSPERYRINAVYNTTNLGDGENRGRRLTNLSLNGYGDTGDLDGSSIVEIAISNKKITGVTQLNWTQRNFLHDILSGLGIVGVSKTSSSASKELEIQQTEEGIIGVAHHHFKADAFDLNDSLGATIPLGKKELSVSIVWQADLPERDLIEALLKETPIPPDATNTNVLVMLNWKVTPTVGASQTSSGAFQFPSAGLTEIARLSNAARTALPKVARQPQSALPALTVAKSERMLAAYPIGLGIEGRGGALRLTMPLSRGTTAMAITAHSEVPKPFEGMKFGGWKVELQPAKEPISASVRLDALFDPGQLDSHDITLAYHPNTFQDSSEWHPAALPAIRYRVSNRGEEGDGGERFRLGSLAFRLGKSLLTNEERSEIVLTRRDGDSINLAAGTPSSSLSIRLDLAVTRADPVTTDIAHGDRDDRPDDILIREENSAQKSTGSFALLLTETLSDDQDRHLTASLERRDTASVAEIAAHRDSFVLLSRKPFAAVRVYSSPGQTEGDAPKEIASFDSDAAVWKWRRTTEDYTYVRPASGVGEGADKPRRFEIIDPEKRTTAPALIDGDTVKPIAVPMRLTPPTILWTRPTDLDRNFAEPRYAIRNLFRQQGDFGFGMQVTGLRTEMVYGLSTGLVPPPATASQPAPRIAELEAITGRMLSAKIDGVGDLWPQLRDTLTDRPEHLEITTLDTSRADAYVPAVFTEGLTFALRSTAFAAPPIDSDLVTAESAAPGFDPVRFDKRGLPGGALWPVEQASVARVLAENPEGTSGSLERIALSPLGDSGDQTARFLNGYAAVITETREGRLSRHRVEILGRIGALWHRAKHVVIYERTTAPSAQFVPTDVQEAERRSQRPILRKVAEFVEILEPIRRYPDAPTATERTAGPLREVRFNVTQIAVDSAWGEDIGRIGWRVPLWNRGAARRRPQVYPFPDISFVTAAEGDGDQPLTVQDCLDPDFLFFYTDPVAAAEISPDTNAWPPRRGIDYTPLGHSDVLAKVVGITASDGAPARRPPDPRIPAGLRNFSWRLAQSARRTRINAGRGQKPLFAGLDSITFMRSPPQPKSDEPAKVDEVFQAKITALPGNQTYPSTFSDLETPTGATALATVITQTTLYKSEPTKDNFDDLRTAWEQFQNSPDAVAQQLRDITGLPSGQTFIDPKTVQILDDVRKFDAESCSDLAAKGAEALRRRELLILRVVGETQAEIRAYVNRWSVPATEAEARAELTAETLKLFKQEMSDIFRTAQSGIGDLRGEVATTRAIIADWHREAQEALIRGQARLEETANSFLSFEVISEERLKRLFGQLNSAVAEIEQDAIALIGEAQTRFSTELSAASRGVGARIGTLVKQSLSTESKIGDSAQGLKDTVEDRARSAVDTIDKLPSSAELKVTRDKVQKAYDDTSNATAKATIKPLLDRLTILSGSGDGSMDDLKNQAKTEIQDAEGIAQEGINDATSLVSNAAQGARAALQGLDDTQKDLAKEASDASEYLEEALALEVQTVANLARDISAELQAITEKLLALFNGYKEVLDQAVEMIRDQLLDLSRQISDTEALAHDAVDTWLGRVETDLADFEKEFPGLVTTAFETQVLNPVVSAFVAEIDWAGLKNNEIALKQDILRASESLGTEVQFALRGLTTLGTDAIAQAEKICKELAGYKDALLDGVDQYLEKAAEALKEKAEDILKEFDVFDPKKVGDVVTASQQLLSLADRAMDEISEGADHVEAYLDKGMEILSGFKDVKAEGLPGQALKLISFASTAPEIAALKAGADRLRMIADEASDLLKSKPVRMALDQLGDLAKSLGLDFSSDGFGDYVSFLPSEKTLNSIIPDFGGMKLSGLLEKAGLDGDLPDWIKVTHDVDEKNGRAWLQVDVDVPLPGRQALFSLGPFTLYFKDSRLVATLRAEASKDSDQFTLTDLAILSTNIEAVVGGQVMVTLEDATISYSSETKLDVDLDPKRIKVHKNLKFIQDTLGQLFGDTLGGLTILKEAGIPVGVEHRFSLPPISLNYLTSGVQNITISNRFALRVLPDFIISNRFNLSSVDQPFIFSIFIIGGTGYIQLDAEYRPFDKRMSVSVEFGAGGSASLAFTWGPVAGGVFITLSVTIRYTKTIGYEKVPARESGLTVSLVLVIAGYVSLWGMVTIYLGLRLSISYHESGRVDGLGVLSVELRISRFFKLKFRTQVTYKLRDGRSETTVSSTVETDVTDSRAKAALEKLKKLENARTSL